MKEDILFYLIMKKLKEYNNLEQRDIWEYEIDLTQEEIDKLVLHSFLS